MATGKRKLRPEEDPNFNPMDDLAPPGNLPLPVRAEKTPPPRPAPRPIVQTKVQIDKMKQEKATKKYAGGGKASFTALDEEGRPYRSDSRQGTSGSPRTTRFTALDKDGKPYRNAASALTDKEIDRLFESGKFRVGRGETPKRMSEDGGMRRGGSVKKYAKGGSVSSASKRADGCAVKGKTRGKFV